MLRPPNDQPVHAGVVGGAGGLIVAVGQLEKAASRESQLQGSAVAGGHAGHVYQSR